MDTIDGIDSMTIGEAAERSGNAASALRYYEQQGLIHASRSSGGQRRFERDVLRRLAFIGAAQRVGLELGEIRAALEQLPDSRTPTRRDWAKLSTAWRPRLDEEIAYLTRLRNQLTECIGCGCLSLKTCALYNPDDEAAERGEGPRFLLDDRSKRAN